MHTRHSCIAAAGIAVALACTDIDEPITAISVDPAISSVQLATHATEADTSARILVSAIATRGSNGERPLVTFTATAGSFTVDGKTQATVTTMVDESDKATVLLRPALSPALAVVRASTGTHYLQDTIRFVVSGLRELRLDRMTVAADGVSLVVLRGIVARTAIGANRDVSFISSAGLLLGGTTAGRTVTADTGNVALAQLQASRDVGAVYVQATAGGVALRDSVRFEVALPERIEIAAPSLLPADQSTAVTITARVTRSIGLPDRRTLVAFTATKPDGTMYGNLGLASGMGDDGKVTVTFASSDTVYSGPVVITARAQGLNAQLQAQATLTVMPK